MKNQPIFVHVPKTGGTSINCVIKGTEWQTPLNYHYRHLDPQSKVSTAGDIFSSESYKQYQGEYIFMMLREPIDRLISEYYYIRKNDDFIRYLSSKPSSFHEYIQNRQTANAMTKFLLGEPLYSKREISNEDVEQVINIIDSLDIHVGIFEAYDRSLSYFHMTGDFQWPETIDVKRATLNRPQVQQLSPALIEQITVANDADIQLYNYCKKRLLDRTENVEIKKVKYKGGKLDFVIPYTMFNCILDIELNNRQFVLENERFFVTLNVYLHKTAATGKMYLKNWLKMFKASVASYYPNTDFAKAVKKVKKADPLQEIIAIAQIIDLASKKPEMGIALGAPRMRLQLTQPMIDIMQQEDKITKGPMHW